ncbi:MAG TPA: DMT family transporter [Steroidobacteraceae bacterium]|nr:DMT family transporter [Steroidobacteraceae bacterium]
MRRLPPAGGGGTLAGIALTMVGAAGFAAKGVIAKFLYADGWGADAVLTTRSLLALPVIAAWALWAVGARALLHPPPRAMLGAALAGCLCYYAGALLDFRALTMIDASVERVLLFSYPSLVVVLYAGIYREWPELRTLVALAMTYAGIVMVVTGLDASVLRGNAAGGGLVLACALTSALYYLASDRWTGAIGSVAFTFYALTAATACLGLHRLLGGGPSATVWQVRDLWLLLALVVPATVVPMLAMAEGVRRLGAPRASVVATVGPPTTILLGAGLLDERLRTAQWLGVALIVAGILALELSKRPAAAAGSQAG